MNKQIMEKDLKKVIKELGFIAPADTVLKERSTLRHRPSE